MASHEKCSEAIMVRTTPSLKRRIEQHRGDRSVAAFIRYVVTRRLDYLDGWLDRRSAGT